MSEARAELKQRGEDVEAAQASIAESIHTLQATCYNGINKLGGLLKVELERLPSRESNLTVELAPEEMEEIKLKGYRKLSPKLNIPGFRRGKAPLAIADRFVGSEALIEQGLEGSLSELTDRALEQEEEIAYAKPELSIESLSPIRWKARIVLKPKVELEGYKEIRLTRDPVQISDDEVQVALERLRERYAAWEPVERPAKFGDQLTLEIEGRAEGKSFLKEKELVTVLSPDRLLPGLAQELEGLTTGQVKQFMLPLPEELSDKELAGKTAFFKAQALDIKERRLPELDDGFAKSLPDGGNTLDELKQKVRQELLNIAEEAAQRQYEEKCLGQLLPRASMEYSPWLVQHELEHIMAEQEEELKRNRVSLEEYLKRTSKTLEQLKEEIRPEAERRVQRSLVMERFAEMEDITVSPEEVEAERQSLAMAVTGGQAPAGFLASDSSRDAIRSVLIRKKSLQRLSQIARTSPPAEVDQPPSEEVSADEPEN